MRDIKKYILVILIVSTPLCASIAHAEADVSLARSPRIFNGEEARPAEAPWAVSINVNDTHHCGGSLIAPLISGAGDVAKAFESNAKDPRWVITAAHCFTRAEKREDIPKEIDKKKFFVKTGSNNLERHGEEHEILEILMHENYNPNGLLNDIALVKIAKGVNRGDVRRRSIRLPEPEDQDWINNPYMAVSVVGWGATENAARAPKLQKIRLPTVAADYCRESYRYRDKTIGNSMICAGFSTGEYDACGGDSGGGLYYKKARGTRGAGLTAQPVLLGVVSWGESCADPNAFGVYTKVSNYIDWIVRKIKNKESGG